MKPEELKKWPYGHHCLNDDKLAEIENARNEAGREEPGDWRVRDGRVVRYGTWMPVAAASALHFLAMCFTWVPQLLRCVRALEDALRSAWREAAGARRELAEERERHAETTKRAATGEWGPMSDLRAVIEAVELGGTTPQPWMVDYPNRPMSDEEHARQVAAVRERLVVGYARKLAAWASGKQIVGDFYCDPDVEQLRRLKAEQDRIAAEQKERDDAERALVRALVEELKLTKAQREAHLARAKKRAGQEVPS